jgi:hypothetical protein
VVKDNLNTFIIKENVRVWTGFVWLRRGEASMNPPMNTSGFIKGKRVFWLNK